MSKKLIISLAAIAAFVVLPAAAQASVPHYFGNGVKLAESACKGETIAGAAACYGEEEVEGASAVKVVNAWGTLELKGETGAAAGGLITCHNVAAGLAYNPTGGGAGRGNTETFAVFNCSSNICLAGEQTGVTAVSLPWPSVLTGETAGTFRSKSGTTEHPVRVLVTCNGAAHAPFEGENAPLGPSGSKKGSSAKAPGITEFDAGSGELSLVNGFGGAKLGTSKTIGELKNLGYNEQELANIK